MRPYEPELPDPANGGRGHCDPEQLALLALGDPADVDTAHLTACEQCGGDLESLRATVAVARASSRADTPQPPPAAVWERVVDQLGLSPAAAAIGAERPSPMSGAATDTGHSGGADVLPFVPRRRRPALLLAAAAAVAGVVVGGTATWLAVRPDEAPPATAEVIATATLEPLPDWASASGDARVEQADGTRLLQVDVSAPAASEGAFREVWLLDRNAKRLVSLGPLPGSSGDFVLPPGLDLAAYPIVDVSREPDDGDPAHSGDSIVRGTLAT